MLRQPTAPERKYRDAFVKGRYSRDLQPTNGLQQPSDIRPVEDDRHVLGRLAGDLSKEQLFLEGHSDTLFQSLRASELRSGQQQAALHQQQSVLNSKLAADRVPKQTSLKLDLDAWHLPPAIAQVNLHTSHSFTAACFI